jgi:hypothetical protein
MGVGPNYVLSKGFLAQGVAAYFSGQLVISGTVEQSVAAAGNLTLLPLGVCTEDIDVTKITPGKAFIGVALLGIARVKAGSAVAKMDRITSNATSLGIPQARTAGASQPQPVFGIALTAQATTNGFFDMLLTPGACY